MRVRLTSALSCSTCSSISFSLSAALMASLSLSSLSLLALSSSSSTPRTRPRSLSASTRHSAVPRSSCPSLSLPFSLSSAIRSIPSSSFTRSSSSRPFASPLAALSSSRSSSFTRSSSSLVRSHPSPSFGPSLSLVLSISISSRRRSSSLTRAPSLSLSPSFSPLPLLLCALATSLWRRSHSAFSTAIVLSRLSHRRCIADRRAAASGSSLSDTAGLAGSASTASPPGRSATALVATVAAVDSSVRMCLRAASSSLRRDGHRGDWGEWEEKRREEWTERDGDEHARLVER